MKNLVKTTAAIGSTEVLLMGVALARNKYLAVTIGPEGFGIYGILNSFFMMIAVFAGTWMATGTIKYTSEYQAKADKENLNSIFSFSTIIVAGIGIFLTIILVVWRKWFINTFLSNEIKEIYYLIFCAAFFAICLRPILLGVLQGLRQVREVIISRWSIAILNLIFTVILVWLWGLTGFFLSLLINAIFAVCILYWGIKRKDGLQLKKFSWQDPVVRLLLTFGSVNLFLAIINLSSQYLQRSIVLHNMDIAAVGLFQAGVALMGYMGVINRGSTFYFFPKMSEVMDNSYRNQKINEYLRFILLLSIPISVMAILFGKWAILILYSSAFTKLSSVFFLFVIGQFLTSIGGVFQSTIVGMARLKMHTVSTTAIVILWILVPLLLIKKYGIGSLGMGFVAGGIVGLMLNGLYLIKNINLIFSRNVIKLFCISVFTLGVAITIRNYILNWRILWLFITFGFISIMVSRKEYVKIHIITLNFFYKFRNYFKKIVDIFKNK